MEGAAAGPCTSWTAQSPATLATSIVPSQATRRWIQQGDNGTANEYGFVNVSGVLSPADTPLNAQGQRRARQENERRRTKMRDPSREKFSGRQRHHAGIGIQRGILRTWLPSKAIEV
jgi:hypothetical protein